MRIEQVQYLDAAIAEGSVRRAAQKLGLSQPSLSQQIQRLEEELDLVLLVRTRSGVRPTESAVRLLPQLHRLLAAERAVTEEASAIRGLHTGRVRLGSVPTAIRVLLHEVIPTFRNTLPNVAVELWESDSEAVAHELVVGALDLGVIGRAPDTRPPWLQDLTTADLCRESLVLCVPSDHRFADGNVRISELRTEPWISHGSGFIFAAASETLFPGAQLEPVFHTNDTATAMIMVGAGVGLAILPRSAALRAPTSRVTLIRDLGKGIVLPELVLTLIQRADTPAAPAARQLVAMLRSQAAVVRSRWNDRPLDRVP
ncbi:LysR family transcriptional regulator [Amycolatopsis alkalitolerans]|uniref:LysR family transcriptional regulator n=1 Tax=Amycolatopsis alkalitolerans TaxID=2547244 RepID=A0A5C4M4Q9_9PSEU|nr:LysR family transcriptional regulator [Amycolatopsis alkalitolerans]TNC25162.1 LysR family transcriptional regulator [Amycolatopsis alkalitolerans]